MVELIGENEYIIFLINNQEMLGNVAGFANKLKNTIVILKPSLTNWTTFVHEIGHLLGLGHPFEGTSFQQGRSTNFMDYSIKQNMFWMWQWADMNKADFSK